MVLEGKFWIMKNPCEPIIIGIQEMKRLPITINLNGERIFSGFDLVRPKAEKPKFLVGEGIRFSGGSKQQQEIVRDILINFKENIFEWSGKYGLFLDHVARIDTGDTPPIACRQFRTPAEKREPMQEILTEYRNRGIIENANSPYNAPMFLAPKPGAKPDMIASKRYRLVADYRKLNEVIVPNLYPMPIIQDMTDALGHHNEFFCTIDLRQGFHHIPIAVQDRHKTAVSTPDGQVQFIVYPYGVKNGPPVFQCAMETILRRHLGKRCLVYIDDIIVFGKTFEELTENLKLIMQDLADAGASIDLGKSTFLAKEIKFLGHIIDQTGSRRLECDLQAVINFPQPKTKRELLSFIGLASYVRSAMPAGFAKLEHRLRKVVPSKGSINTVQWTDDAINAFQETKEAMTKVTRLTRFHQDRTTEIHCDASAISLGAILIQKDERGQTYVIEYASRVLNEAEQKYSNTERELLAAVWAVTKKFRHYLETRQFTIVTDHKALLGTLKLTQQPSTRTIRFLMQLEPFNYTFQHCPGKELTGPDALSRVVISAAITSELPVPPIEQRQEIINDYHKEFGHQGWKKVYQGIKERFRWPTMRKDIWEQIRACQTCFRFNSATVKVGTELESIRVTQPRQLLCIDFCGPLPFTSRGDRYAMIAVDHFSKMAFGQIISNRNTDTAIKFLADLFQEHGKWQTVMGDRDTVFRSHRFINFLQSQGCNLHVAQATHSEANGCCERFIKTLNSIMAKKMHENQQNDTQWNLILLDSIQCYNGTPHSTTNAVPGEVFLSRPWILKSDEKFGVMNRSKEQKQVSWADIVKSSKKQQDNSIKTASKAKWPHFKVGDRVAIVPRLPNEKKHDANRRFRERKRGPYKVIAYEGKGIYSLFDGQQTIRGNAWELISCATGIFPPPQEDTDNNKRRRGRIRDNSLITTS
jgi:transposase InsO family protein